MPSLTEASETSDIRHTSLRKSLKNYLNLRYFSTIMCKDFDLNHRLFALQTLLGY